MNWKKNILIYYKRFEKVQTRVWLNTQHALTVSLFHNYFFFIFSFIFFFSFAYSRWHCHYCLDYIRYNCLHFRLVWIWVRRTNNCFFSSTPSDWFHLKQNTLTEAGSNNREWNWEVTKNVIVICLNHTCTHDNKKKAGKNKHFEEINNKT